MKIRGLGYIGFETPEPRQWREFGPEVLGLGLVDGHSNDDSVYLRMDDRHHRWAIHPGEKPRLAYAGWELGNKEDFDEAIGVLEKEGVPFEPANDAELLDRCVAGMVGFRDPADFHHELFYGPGARRRSFLPGRTHGGFVTGDQGMGHLVLHIPNYKECHEFFTQVMGFPSYGLREIPSVGGVAFYRSARGYRQHVLAMLGFGGLRGVHHVMIENNELEDVLISWSITVDRGLPIPINLGRHRGDEMVSYYVESPSGFFIEYGYGGIRIDDEYLHNLVVERPFGGGDPGSHWGHKTSTGLPESMTVPTTVEKVDYPPTAVL